MHKMPWVRKFKYLKFGDCAGFMGGYIALPLAAAFFHGHTVAATSESIMKTARDLEGTFSVNVMNQSSEGVVEACGFEFKALGFDRVYKDGDPFVLSGSFAIRSLKGRGLYITYKVGTLSFGQQGDIQEKAEAPNYAWMKFDKVLVKPEHKKESDTDGYNLYITAVTKANTSVIETIMKQGKVSIGFNRRDGGLDVVVPIDLDVRSIDVQNEKITRKRDKKVGQEFSECLSILISSSK